VETDAGGADGEDWSRLRPRFVPRPGVDPAGLRFGPLGYAEHALRSYADFRAARAAGVVPGHWRFMVAMPTPLAPVNRFIEADHRAALEPAYEAAMLAELATIAAAVPHEDLAIQWDAPHEIGTWEGFFPSFFDGDPRVETVTRLARLAAAVPDEVELGIHLCYGDAQHRHFVQPKDTGIAVALANAIAGAVSRPINWLHLPVPRDRTDDAYFAPLSGLRLHPETEFYLGLVHLTDGAAGTRERIRTAGRYLDAFGVATECGFGRRPPEDVPALLHIHRDVAGPDRVPARDRTS
jgi:methionine synthase II (cobalamin-independent)